MNNDPKSHLLLAESLIDGNHTTLRSLAIQLTHTTSAMPAEVEVCRAELTLAIDKAISHPYGMSNYAQIIAVAARMGAAASTEALKAKKNKKIVQSLNKNGSQS